MLLSADKLPAEAGQIVYSVHNGKPCRVEHVKHFSFDDVATLIVSDKEGVLHTVHADEVTHEMP